jgi:ribosome-associated translation inhibitor RaiA
MSEPRLRNLIKLKKLRALHDDHAATDGERVNCRRLGEKIASEVGIKFSRAAIDAEIKKVNPLAADDDLIREFRKKWKKGKRRRPGVNTRKR